MSARLVGAQACQLGLELTHARLCLLLSSLCLLLSSLCLLLSSLARCFELGLDQLVPAGVAREA